jgi:sterol desaturase/sphingolipid hydroxylase (fatty acid hydroxylase superfamily)
MLGCVAQWRLHRVHHSDTAVDSTTGVRFPPIEILLSMLYKMWWVVCIGAPPAAVLAWEVLLNASSLFNHGNVRLPGCVDRVLRRLLVTPDMHRVHRSVHRDETDSNYKFTLSVWDRLFGTYRASPKDGHEKMTFGVQEFRVRARPAPASSAAAAGVGGRGSRRPRSASAEGFVWRFKGFTGRTIDGGRRRPGAGAPLRRADHQ